jgi:hypothetical protein
MHPRRVWNPGSGRPGCGLSSKEASPLSLSYVVLLYYIPQSNPATMRHVETHIKLTAFPLRPQSHVM